MASGVANLQIVLQARDQASKVLDRAGLNSEKFRKRATTAFKGAAVGMAALGGVSLKMAVDFESSMAEVKTLLPDLDEEGFGKLRKGVLALSKEMGVATSESVPALYQAISAGVPPDNVFEFMEIASKAAVGGITDLETAVDGISSVVNAYGEEVLDAQRASDLMFTAVKLGKTDFNQLSNSLFNVIPTAASLGISMEEVSASLARMTAQGTPTSVATTQLRAAFVEASKGGSVLDKAIRELHGKGMKDLIAGGMTAQQVFETLRVATANSGGEFSDLFGSVEAMNAVLAITGKNAEAFESALTEMNDAAGATDAAFNTMSDTVKFKTDKAINSIKVRFTEFGGVLLQQMPLLGAGGAAIAGIAPLAAVAAPALGLMGTAWTGMGVAARIAWVAVTGPVGIAIAAIAAGIAIGVLIWKNWDTIKAKALEVFGFIEGIFRSKWGWILPGGVLIKAILFLKDNWRAIWDSILEKTENVMEGIKSVVRDGMTMVLEFINGIIKAWNALEFKVPEFRIAGRTFGGQSFGLPNIPEIPIPSFARGGIIPGRLGQAVPILAHAGEVVLNRQQQGAMGGGIQLIFNAPVYGIEDFETQVETITRRAMRRGGFRGVIASG